MSPWKDAQKGARLAFGRAYWQEAMAKYASPRAAAAATGITVGDVYRCLNQFEVSYPKYHHVGNWETPLPD